MEKEKETITLTRALAELKLLDKKIEKYTRPEVLWTGVALNGLVGGRHTKEAMKNSAVHCKQELQGLLARRNEIKSKLLSANNTVKVRVAGKNMTIASAIDRKNFVRTEQEAFRIILTQVRESQSQLAQHNAKIERQVEDAVNVALGTTGSKTAIKEIADNVRAASKYELVDPAGAEKWATDELMACEEFLTEIDYSLSEANSINTIELKEVKTPKSK